MSMKVFHRSEAPFHKNTSFYPFILCLEGLVTRLGYQYWFPAVAFLHHPGAKAAATLGLLPHPHLFS